MCGGGGAGKRVNSLFFHALLCSTLLSSTTLPVRLRTHITEKHLVFPHTASPWASITTTKNPSFMQNLLRNARAGLVVHQSSLPRNSISKTRLELRNPIGRLVHVIDPSRAEFGRCWFGCAECEWTSLDHVWRWRCSWLSDRVTLKGECIFNVRSKFKFCSRQPRDGQTRNSAKLSPDFLTGPLLNSPLSLRRCPSIPSIWLDRNLTRNKSKKRKLVHVAIQDQRCNHSSTLRHKTMAKQCKASRSVYSLLERTGIKYVDIVIYYPSSSNLSWVGYDAATDVHLRE